MAEAAILHSSTHCQGLENPNPLPVFLAAFIFIGIIVSYLPQHGKIITQGTSEGLSPWWVLLGGLSAIAAIGNILTLPTSREDIKCCKELTGTECAAALLGVAQIGLQWACFMFMYALPALADIIMLFLIYFPANPDGDLSTSTASLTKAPPAARRDQVIVGFATLLTLFVVGIVSITLVAAYPHHTQNWADFLGTLAGILAMVQYIPQIYYTWRLGEVRSLSIITMLIQVPGSFLFAFSLFLRVGTEGWSTWLVYLVTGSLQAVLLGLAILYWLDSRRIASQQENGDTLPQEQSPPLSTAVIGPDGASEDQTEATERTALLQRANNG